MQSGLNKVDSAVISPSFSIMLVRKFGQTPIKIISQWITIVASDPLSGEYQKDLYLSAPGDRVT